MDIGDICDICGVLGLADCTHCYLGNPCIGCTNYDEKNDVCLLNGGCIPKEE